MQKRSTLHCRSTVDCGLYDYGWRLHLCQSFINSSGLMHGEAAAHLFHQMQSLQKLPDNIHCTCSLCYYWAWHLGCPSISSSVFTVIGVKCQCNPSANSPDISAREPRRNTLLDAIPSSSTSAKMSSCVSFTEVVLLTLPLPSACTVKFVHLKQLSAFSWSFPLLSGCH